MNKLFLSLILIVILNITASSVFASQIPNFPVCTNPQGELKVKYESGTHGIVGDPNQYSGSDAVYQITNDTFTQCFCSTNGSGIQTNWWKISSLLQDEIDTLKNLGWTYIPTGSVWGLSDDPYMAINSSYSCSGGSTTTTSSGGSSSSTNSSSSSNSSDPTNQGVGGQVLGLASTGNLKNIFNLVIFGLILVIAGILLKKNIFK